MAVAPTDIRTLLTSATGPGNTYPQAAPSASLGGYASHTPWYGGTAGDLFSPIRVAAQALGQAEYRAVFVMNAHPSEEMPDVRVYVVDQADGGATLAIGVDPNPVAPLGSAAAQGVSVAAATAAPAGVTFSTVETFEDGVRLGTLPAGSGRVLWLERTPDPLDPQALGEATLAIEVGD